MKDRVLEKVASAGKEQGWIDSTDPMVAAVSGGGDSIALVTALREIYKGPITVAHLEHGIREGSSLSDANFVRSFCESNGIPFFFRSTPVPRMRKHGESMEEAARRIRYSFLEEARKLVNGSWIAVGHNSNDVVETVLLNLLRGTGLAGLCGLPGRRGEIIRPLINCSRDELRDFLRSRGQDWREDESNEDTHYFRNRIRMQLLPEISSHYNPAFNEKVLSLRKTLLPCRELLEERGGLASRLLRRNLPLAISSWDLKSLRQLENNARSELFRHEGSRLGLSTLDYRQMDRLIGLLLSRQGWRFQWEQTFEIRTGAGFVALLDRRLFDRAPDKPIVIDSTSGTARWGAGRFSWERASSKGMAVSDFTALLPAMESPVILPSREALPSSALGKIPWFYRKCWPTVVFGDKMSWTPFWNFSKSAGFTDSFCLRLTYTPDQDMGVSRDGLRTREHPD